MSLSFVVSGQKCKKPMGGPACSREPVRSVVISCNLLCGPPLESRITRYTRPSVRLSVCLVTTVNSKTENHAMLKRRGQVIHVRQSDFEVKRLNVKVNIGA